MINLPLQNFSNSFKRIYSDAVWDFFKERITQQRLILAQISSLNDHELELFVRNLAVGSFSELHNVLINNFNIDPSYINVLSNPVNERQIIHILNQLLEALKKAQNRPDYVHLFAVILLHLELSKTMNLIDDTNTFKLEHLFDYNAFFRKENNHWLKAQIAAESGLKVCPY